MKKQKTMEVPLWKQIIEQFPFNKDKDAKLEASRIKKYVDFTKSLISDFTYVNVFMNNDVLYWHYYKGRGKTFHDGKCSMFTDAANNESNIDNEFLLPMVQQAYGKPITRTTSRTVAQIEYDYDQHNKIVSEVA